MSGLGGLNKSPSGVVIGLVQLQLPTVVTKADLAAQTAKIVAMASPPGSHPSHFLAASKRDCVMPA
mgnify:CR=1 FL=1